MNKYFSKVLCSLFLIYDIELRAGGRNPIYHGNGVWTSSKVYSDTTVTAVFLIILLSILFLTILIVRKNDIKEGIINTASFLNKPIKAIFYLNIGMLLVIIISFSQNLLSEKALFYLPYLMSIFGSYLMLIRVTSGMILFILGQAFLILVGLIGISDNLLQIKFNDLLVGSDLVNIALIPFGLVILIPVLSIIIVYKYFEYPVDKLNSSVPIVKSKEEIETAALLEKINLLLRQRKTLSLSNITPSEFSEKSKALTLEIEKCNSELFEIKVIACIKKRIMPQLEILENQRRLKLLKDDEFLRKQEQLIQKFRNEHKGECE